MTRRCLSDDLMRTPSAEELTELVRITCSFDNSVSTSASILISVELRILLVSGRRGDGHRARMAGRHWQLA